MVIQNISRPISDNAQHGRYLQSKMAYMAYFDFLKVGIFRGLIVQINYKSLDIGLHGN